MDPTLNAQGLQILPLHPLRRYILILAFQTSIFSTHALKTLGLSVAVVFLVPLEGSFVPIELPFVPIELSLVPIEI